MESMRPFTSFKTILESKCSCDDASSARLVLDIDATDTPLHGEQEDRFFHAYYDNYRYCCRVVYKFVCKNEKRVVTTDELLESVVLSGMWRCLDAQGASKHKSFVTQLMAKEQKMIWEDYTHNTTKQSACHHLADDEEFVRRRSTRCWRVR